jgi:hypothetical protein
VSWSLLTWRRQWISWGVAVVALIAFTVLTSQGKDVLGSVSASVTAVATVYGIYEQRRSEHTPATPVPKPSSLVIVCYIREDLRWALWLEERLNGNGFYAQSQLLPANQDPEAIAEWARQVLEEAACVLIVASPLLGNSGPGVDRRIAALLRTHRGQLRTVAVHTAEPAMSPAPATPIPHTLTPAGPPRRGNSASPIRA